MGFLFVILILFLIPVITSGSPAQRRKHLPHLVVDLIWVGQGVRNRGSHDIAITLAQSVDRHADRLPGLGLIGTRTRENRWGQDRIVGFNLNYFDLGDAPVENDIPLLGTIREVYTDRTAIGIGLSLRWLR